MKQLSNYDPFAINQIQLFFYKKNKYATLKSIVISLLIIFITTVLSWDALSNIWITRQNLNIESSLTKISYLPLTQNYLCVISKGAASVPNSTLINYNMVTNTTATIFSQTNVVDKANGRSFNCYDMAGTILNSDYKLVLSVNGPFDLLVKTRSLAETLGSSGPFYQYISLTFDAVLYMDDSVSTPHKQSEIIRNGREPNNYHKKLKQIDFFKDISFQQMPGHFLDLNYNRNKSLQNQQKVDEKNIIMNNNLTSKSSRQLANYKCQQSLNSYFSFKKQIQKDKTTIPLCELSKRLYAIIKEANKITPKLLIESFCYRLMNENLVKEQCLKNKNYFKSLIQKVNHIINALVAAEILQKQDYSIAFPKKSIRFENKLNHKRILRQRFRLDLSNKQKSIIAKKTQLQSLQAYYSKIKGPLDQLVKSRKLLSVDDSKNLPQMQFCGKRQEEISKTTQSNTEQAEST